MAPGQAHDQAFSPDGTQSVATQSVATQSVATQSVATQFIAAQSITAAWSELAAATPCFGPRISSSRGSIGNAISIISFQSLL